MKNKALYVIALIVVLAIGFKVFSGGTFDAGSEDNNNDNSINVGVGDDSDAQIVNVGFSGGNYVLTPSTVEANKPVLLKGSGALRGCALYMIQPELGINTNFAKDNEYVFTPTKKGDFTVSCSMGMYKGKLTVV